MVFRIEPKGHVTRAFLPKDKPCLILMDEIISYVSTYCKAGYHNCLYNFMQSLSERGELWVRGDLYRRRADIVGFVNALTLVFMVRKNVTLPASIFYAVYFQMDDGAFVIGRDKTCN
jgi:hypothetical protein